MSTAKTPKSYEQIYFDIVTAQELVATPMEPIQMVVGDIIPAGLFLIAGDPKVGKSLLFQDLALAIATGEKAWGEYEVEKGDVLYMANEGGDRSFRDRLIKMMDLPADFPGELTGDAAEPAPPGLKITKTDLLLGGKLESAIHTWLNETATDPRLVIIDTLASVTEETGGSNRHLEDYKALASLAELATGWPKTLFIVIHHTNKGEGTSVTQRISGSNGLAAATDGIGLLTRNVASPNCTFTLIPRNAEECELTMQRGQNLRWGVLGDDEVAQLSGARQQLVKLLEASAEPVTPAAAAKELCLEAPTVRKALVEMAKKGQVTKHSHGHYVAVAS